LLSGKVLQVVYNAGNPSAPDRFFHRYTYDANSRLKAVYTSTDGEMWHRDAAYEYYLHGPLKRTVIGEDEVQGLDYTYTIHGWLKGINHPILEVINDPGNDGGAVAAGKESARDAFGMSLGFFTGDYKNAASKLDDSNLPAANRLLPLAGGKDRSLYNGNISSWATNAAGWQALGSSVKQQGTTGQVYTYDELNRIRISEFKSGTTYSSTSDYNNTYQYSSNGNITMATATTQGGTTLDNLTYKYPTYTDPQRANAVRPLSNKLQQVLDAAAASSFADDVESGQGAANYVYDAIGNLVSDAQQKIGIEWNPYGKVKAVKRYSDANLTTLTGGRMEFLYDAAGNRVRKRTINVSGLITDHYYVRDAAGNIMAVYEKKQEVGVTNPETTLLEIPIYGRDRLGRYVGFASLSNTSETPLLPGENRITTDRSVNAYQDVDYLVNPGVTLTIAPGFVFTSITSTDGTTTSSFNVRVGAPVAGTIVAGMYTRELKERQYELKDHLGNVRVVVSDLKLSTITNNVVSNFIPDLLNIQHYYPFGMDMPDRNWQSGDKYRYGFNGKEKDKGEWGSGTNYDYGFRIYNPAIGKFLSVDPLRSSYPRYSPYQFAGNTPVQATDLDGLEENYVFDLDEFDKKFPGLIKYTAEMTKEQRDNVVRQALMKVYYIEEGPTKYQFASARARHDVLAAAEANGLSGKQTSDLYALYALSASTILNVDDFKKYFIKKVPEPTSWQLYSAWKKKEDDKARAEYQRFIKESESEIAWGDVGGVLTNVGDGAQVVGLVLIHIPGGQTVGGVLLLSGKVLSFAGEAASIYDNVKNENYNKAILDAEILFIDAMAGQVMKTYKMAKKTSDLLQSAKITTMNGVGKGVDAALDEKK
jgi:RHS repeat-associated protein